MSILRYLDGNNGHRDFLAISLNDGKIRVGLSFGGQKPLVIDMNRGPRLNDNKWHHVQVSHEVKVCVGFYFCYIGNNFNNV
jgi:hypothetical protein